MLQVTPWFCEPGSCQGGDKSKRRKGHSRPTEDSVVYAIYHKNFLHELMNT